MAPSLAFSDYQHTGQVTADSAVLTCGSFTPTNGDIIVVKAQTWDTGNAPGAVSGGGQTFTTQVDNAPGGFRPRSRISTAVVAGSPGSMTVSVAAPGSNCHHDMTVEVWTSATLALTPATGSASAGSGPAAGTVTTVGTGSIVSWCAADISSIDPATRAYLSSATEVGISDGHTPNTNGVLYSAYQSAAAAGSQSIGLSTPSGMTWTIVGIEIQTAGGGGGATGVARPRMFPSLAATQRASW